MTGQTTSRQKSIRPRSIPKRSQISSAAPRYLASATPRSLKRLESSVKAILKVKRHITRSKLRKDLLNNKMKPNPRLR